MRKTGVYIKCLEIPSSCCDCDMIELSGAIGCYHAYDMKNSDSGRASDCPLVLIPPHGRLIDANYVMNNMRSEHPYVQNAIRATIGAAPTIIPAEEE